jgi:hypothetical protein
MIDPPSECVLFLLHCMGPVLAQTGTSPILFIFGGEADIYALGQRMRHVWC